MIELLTLELYAARALLWLVVIGPTVALLGHILVTSFRDMREDERRLREMERDSWRTLQASGWRRFRVVTGGTPTPTRKEARR